MRAILEEPFSLSELTKIVLDLRERVRLLESGELRAGLFTGFPMSQQRKPGTMGRPPKLASEEVIQRRNHLSHWIENCWPILFLALRKAKSATEALDAIESAKRQHQEVMPVRFYNGPEHYAESLWSFLKSGRFHGSPRNLAGAMAGLPELSWKRSLDISQKHALNRPLEPPAWRDHLMRHFPKRFRELRKATSAVQIKAILSKSHSSDKTYRHLKKHPHEVLKWVLGRGDTDDQVQPQVRRTIGRVIR